MRFQIKQVILWPKADSLPPRIVSFAPDRLNVLSGVSRTGKSAIIPIIDYCLGADRCTIPTGVIRDTTEWFGVLVTTSEGEKLFARREPGQSQATDDMHIAEGPELNIPTSIKKNATRDSVKQRLDQLAGLTKLSFSADQSEEGFGRPSFRDLVAFIFQPQNIVANPNVFFYKADTAEHRLKLRTILPYVLGAISAEILGKRRELTALQRELRRRGSELAAIRNISERWRSSMRARLLEARDLGLLDPSIPLPDSQMAVIDLLRSLTSIRQPDPQITSTTMQEGIGELHRLDAEETELSQALAVLRRRYSEMIQLRASASEFQGSLRLQRDRLEISRWLRHDGGDSAQCPICGNDLQDAQHSLNELEAALVTIEAAAAQIDAAPPSFDREVERVRSAISEDTERLRGVQIRQAALSQRSERASRQHYTVLAASRFLGSLEADLKTFESVGNDGDLSAEVEELRASVADLERDIARANVTERIQRALTSVNLNAGRLMPHLDAERPDDPVSLLDQELTVSIRGPMRDDFLWELGSGSNWLSYHIAVTLGLQQFFIALRDCPVPSFLVYDQPSQVYFPKRLAMRANDITIDPEWQDEDVEAVKKVLNTISIAIHASRDLLQVIVLDHASESVWGEMPNVHLVEDWRDGRALIPQSWIAHL